MEQWSATELLVGPVPPGVSRYAAIRCIPELSAVTGGAPTSGSLRGYGLRRAGVGKIRMRCEHGRVAGPGWVATRTSGPGQICCNDRVLPVSPPRVTPLWV